MPLPLKGFGSPGFTPSKPFCEQRVRTCVRKYRITFYLNKCEAKESRYDGMGSTYRPGEISSNQLPCLYQTIRLVVISHEGSSKKNIVEYFDSNLAGHHGRKEADHELAIAHQEVGVATEQDIFSACDCSSRSKGCRSTRTISTSLCFMKRSRLTFDTLSIQRFRSLHTHSC